MKIYIAGPMTGIADFNYPAFNVAEQILLLQGHKVFNPVHSEKENTGEYQQQDWNWYLRNAIKLLVDADAICLLPMWHKSQGANLEVHIAKSLGMPLMMLDFNDNLVLMGEER